MYNPRLSTFLFWPGPLSSTVGSVKGYFHQSMLSTDTGMRSVDVHWGKPYPIWRTVSLDMFIAPWPLTYMIKIMFMMMTVLNMTKEMIMMTEINRILQKMKLVCRFTRSSSSTLVSSVESNLLSSQTWRFTGELILGSVLSVRNNNMTMMMTMMMMMMMTMMMIMRAKMIIMMTMMMLQVKPFQCRHDPAACRVAFTTKQCLQVEFPCHHHHPRQYQHHRHQYQYHHLSYM